MTHMGMFDTIHTGQRCGQTKAFGCLLQDLRPGDPVNRADSQYAMHEGGWLIVRSGHIEAWVDEADPDLPRYDNGANPLRNDPPEGYRYPLPDRERAAAKLQDRHRISGNDTAPTEAEIDATLAAELAAATGRPTGCSICAQLCSNSGDDGQ